MESVKKEKFRDFVFFNSMGSSIVRIIFDTFAIFGTTLEVSGISMDRPD